MSRYLKIQIAIFAFGFALGPTAGMAEDGASSRKILGEYSSVKVAFLEGKVFFDLLLQEFEFVDKHPQMVSQAYRFAVYCRLADDLDHLEEPYDGVQKLEFLQQKADLLNRLSLKFQTSDKHQGQLLSVTANAVLALGERAGLLIDLGRLPEARQNLWMARKVADSSCFKGEEQSTACDLHLVLSLLECELLEAEEHGLEAEDLFRTLVWQVGQAGAPAAKTSSSTDLSQVMTVKKDSSKVALTEGAGQAAVVSPVSLSSSSSSSVPQVVSKKVLSPTVSPSNFVTGDISARQEVVEAYAAFLVRHKRYAEARRLLLKELSGVKALDSLYFIPELDDADTFHSNWDMAEKLRELGLWQEAQSKYELALKRARNADEVLRLRLVMRARMPRVLPSPAVAKLCRQAEKACLRGNFQVGQALYLKALEGEPQCQESLRKLSGLALKEGKVDEACRYLDLVLRFNPDNARATVEKARLTLLGKNKEDACKMALRALEMDADDRYVLDMAMKVMKVGLP